MAVVEVSVLWEGAQGGVDAKLTKTRTRVYQVICDSINDNENTVLDSGLLPAWGALDSSIGAVVQDRQAVSVDRNDGLFVWHATIKWSNEFPRNNNGGQTPEQQNPDPTLRPPIVRYFSQKQRVPFWHRDLDGEPIVNAALQPFTPFPEIDESISCIFISRNRPAALFSQENIDNLQGTINNATFLGFPKWSLKVECQAENKWENNIYYWQEDYTLMRAPRSIGGVWHPYKILNQGYYHAKSAISGQDPSKPPELEVNTDKKTGIPFTAPQLLAANGTLLAINAAPVYLEFKAYYEQPFNWILM